MELFHFSSSEPSLTLSRTSWSWTRRTSRGCWSCWSSATPAYRPRPGQCSRPSSGRASGTFRYGTMFVTWTRALKRIIAPKWIYLTCAECCFKFLMKNYPTLKLSKGSFHLVQGVLTCRRERFVSIFLSILIPSFP